MPLSILQAVDGCLLVDFIDADEIMEFLEQAKLSTPGDEWERKYYSDFFEHLKEAYRTTAREGAGLGSCSAKRLLENMGQEC